jgi:hypothetical protein
VNTTKTTKQHGRNERVWRVIGISVCVTLASLACLVGATILVNTMRATTGRAELTAPCDTMKETSIKPAQCAIPTRAETLQSTEYD